MIMCKGAVDERIEERDRGQRRIAKEGCIRERRGHTGISLMPIMTLSGITIIFQRGATYQLMVSYKVSDPSDTKSP